MFVAMSRSYVDTLPRKRGMVVISEQTIGRYTGHGLQSSIWSDTIGRGAGVQRCAPQSKFVQKTNVSTTFYDQKRICGRGSGAVEGAYKLQ